MRQERIELTPAQYGMLCMAVMKRDGYRCRSCRFRNGLHCHHVQYRSHGGSDVITNMLTLCNQCHLRGIHEGHLQIVVAGVTLTGSEPVDIEANPVRFVRVGNWKPQ